MADPTVQQIMEERIPNRLRENPALAREIDAVVHFDIGGRVWTLDCSGAEGKIEPGASGTPKMTVGAAEADFVKIATRQLNANMAAMSGKLKFKPMDLGLAMKLAKLIG